MITRHIKVIGRVQGVGFRRWVQEQATLAHLSGWVRNTSDGAVEIMMQGDEKDINSFLSLCVKGSLFSSVLGIQPIIIPQNEPLPIESGIFKIIASA